MGWLLLLASIGYSAVSTFGAWSVARRRRGLAFTFLGSAGLLIVGGVAAVYRLPESVYLLGAGSVLASFASIWNARRVLQQVIVLNHVGRALYGVALVLGGVLAFW